MNRSVDPYDALASIFLPGGRVEDAAPAALDEPLPFAPGEAPWDRPVDVALPHAADPLFPADPLLPAGMTSEATRVAAAGRDAAEESPMTIPARRPAEVFASPRPTRPQPAPWAGGESGRPAELELLVPGHLPVRASAWLTPCLRAVAGPGVASGLFRFDGHDAAGDATVELELHGPAASPGPSGSLAEAVRRLGGRVRHWFLRPPTSLPLESMAELEADRVTILTGPDPVAVTSAWEIARRILAGADEAGLPRPSLGLVVVGSTREEADRVRGRLDHLLRDRLGGSVELRGCIARIEPGSAPTDVIRGHASESDPAWVSGLVRSVARAGGGDVADGLASAPGAGLAIGFEEHAVHAPVLASIRRQGDRAGAEPLEWSTGMGEEPPAADPPRSRVRPEAARSVPARASVRPTPRPEYARHLEGLHGLAARSPAHPEIELSVDDAGTLHLLGGLAAVRDLPVVAEWAVRHAELLAMACPNRPIDPLRRPEFHVLCDDALAMGDLHQGPMHLHLLREIELDGHRGWFTAPLYRPQPR